jgi:site-specific recombinase XerD
MSEEVAVIRSAELVAVVPADRNPVAIYLSHLSAGSRRAMKQSLRVVAGILRPGISIFEFPWWEIRYVEAEALRTALREKYTCAATVNRHLTAMRGVLRVCFNLGMVTADEHLRAVGVKGVKGDSVPAGRALEPSEIEALFLAAKGTEWKPSGRRNAALLAVLYGAGLRREEVVDLDMCSLKKDGALVVRGKGNKVRLVYLQPLAQQAVDGWVGERGTEPGPLFLGISKGGVIRHGRRLTPGAVAWILSRLQLKTGLSHFSPHDFRRTFITVLLDANQPIEQVRKLAGHAHVNTTAKYDRSAEKAKKKVAEVLRVPYVV